MDMMRYDKWIWHWGRAEFDWDGSTAEFFWCDVAKKGTVGALVM